MAKKWRPVEGLEGYEVSNKGEIRCWRGMGRQLIAPSPRILSLCTTSTSDYLYFKHTGGQKSVHREVAKAFIPNPDNLPDINHVDEDKKNNSIDNLVWCTKSTNMEHSFGKVVRAYDPEGVLLEFSSISALSKAIGCNQGNASRFIRGTRYNGSYKSWRICNG